MSAHGIRVAAQALLDRLRGLQAQEPAAHEVLVQADQEIRGLQMLLDAAPRPHGRWATEPSDAVARLRGAELPHGSPARSISLQEEIAFIGDEHQRPIFATVAIEYEPAGALLHQEGLALYLWSWRDVQTRADALAVAIAEDVAGAIMARTVKVVITQRPSPMAGALALQAYAAR